MKITEGVTIYQCGHCNKKYFRKHDCEYHEKICFHNPENKRQCFSCPHLTKRLAQADIGDYYDERNVFYCSWYNNFLISPTTIAKGNAFNLCDFTPDIMPSECDASDAIKEIDSLDFLD